MCFKMRLQPILKIYNKVEICLFSYKMQKEENIYIENVEH